MKWVSLMMMLSGFFGVVGKHKHLMNMIISMEFMMLGLIFILILNLVLLEGSGYLLLVLFTFMVSEGALGLSIIVGLIRSHGSDYFLSFNILQC